MVSRLKPIRQVELKFFGTISRPVVITEMKPRHALGCASQLLPVNAGILCLSLKGMTLFQRNVAVSFVKPFTLKLKTYVGFFLLKYLKSKQTFDQQSVKVTSSGVCVIYLCESLLNQKNWKLQALTRSSVSVKL